MALKIDKILSTGFTINYFRVTEINCSVDSGKCNIYVAGYKTQEDRDDGKNKVATYNFDVDIDPKVFDKKIIDEVYKELKKNDFFENAEDV